MPDAPPRRFAIRNPERMAALLRELVIAWDGDDRDRFFRALEQARELLDDHARAQGHQ
jgi:hypothetical protein